MILPNFLLILPLQDLALNNNMLKEVPKAIRPLTLLRTLDIGENQIGTIRSKDFDGLHNLYGLRLAGNGIERLQDDVFQAVPTLQVYLKKTFVPFSLKHSYRSNQKKYVILMSKETFT